MLPNSALCEAGSGQVFWATPRPPFGLGAEVFPSPAPPPLLCTPPPEKGERASLQRRPPPTHSHTHVEAPEGGKSHGGNAASPSPSAWGPSSLTGGGRAEKLPSTAASPREEATLDRAEALEDGAAVEARSSESLPSASGRGGGGGGRLDPLGGARGGSSGGGGKGGGG